MHEKPYVVKRRNIRLVSEPTDYRETVNIKSSTTIAHFARHKLYENDIEIYESAYIIMLNRANDTLGYVRTSIGGVSGTVMDPKIIVKYAVEFLASAIILVHNHPSGNLKPSDPDEVITEKVKNALGFLDITLLDHIILSPENGKYLSFSDEGLI